MQKIMFNDRYGLAQAVLEGCKTMTRRVIGSYYNEILDMSRYAKGEVIAIAQPYKDVPPYKGHPGYSNHRDLSVGWENKMFVKANLMPYFIKITNIRVERLQDISDEDCFA